MQSTVADMSSETGSDSAREPTVDGDPGDVEAVAYIFTHPKFPEGFRIIVSKGQSVRPLYDEHPELNMGVPFEDPELRIDPPFDFIIPADKLP